MRTGPVLGSKNKSKRPTPERASPFSAPYARTNSSQRVPVVGAAAPVTRSGSSASGGREEREESVPPLGPRVEALREAEAQVSSAVPASPVSLPSPQDPQTAMRASSRRAPILPAASSVAEASSEPGARGPVREASGRFGAGVDLVRAMTPMDKFASIVRCKVGQQMKRKGHGSKHGVSGKLDGGSPWFYPDDPLVSAIPDRDEHMMRPIFVCVWEFLDSDIKAPSCPNCCSPNHVSLSVWLVGRPLYRRLVRRALDVILLHVVIKCLRFDHDYLYRVSLCCRFRFSGADFCWLCL